MQEMTYRKDLYYIKKELKPGYWTERVVPMWKWYLYYLLPQYRKWKNFRVLENRIDSSDLL
jgi:hypothetical protein